MSFQEERELLLLLLLIVIVFASITIPTETRLDRLEAAVAALEGR